MLGFRDKIEHKERERQELIDNKLSAYHQTCDACRIEGRKAAQGLPHDEELILSVITTSREAEKFEEYARRSIELDSLMTKLSDLTQEHADCVAERTSLHESVHGAGQHRRSALDTAASRATQAFENNNQLDWDVVVAWRKAKRAFEDVQDRYEFIRKKLARLNRQVQEAKQAADVPWAPDPSSGLPPHHAFPMPAMRDGA